MAHYVHDERNNRVIAYSAEEFLSVLAQAIEDGDLDNITAASAFITKIKSITDNKTYQIAFCTQAVYNQLEQDEELEQDTLYIITDDATYDDLEEYLDNLNTTVTSQGDTIAGLSGTVADHTTSLATLTTQVAGLISKLSVVDYITYLGAVYLSAAETGGLFTLKFDYEDLSANTATCQQLISIDDLTQDLKLRVCVDNSASYNSVSTTETRVFLYLEIYYDAAVRKIYVERVNKTTYIHDNTYTTGETTEDVAITSCKKLVSY